MCLKIIGRIRKVDIRLNNNKILDELRGEIIFQKCCRLDIRTDKSLFIGFGEKHKPKKHIYKSGRVWESCVEFYGAWELCIYDSSWRIHKNQKIIVASETLPEEIMPEFINSIKLVETKLLAIEMLSEIDTRFIFENDIIVDILCCFSDECGVWHVLRNNDKVWWALESSGVWTKGKDHSPIARTYLDIDV